MNTYGTEILTLSLGKYGPAWFARWKHPLNEDNYHLLITEAEVDKLSKWIKPGDCAVDVGAYAGDTALPLAVACGKEGIVYAFEPNRFVGAVLLENAALNPQFAPIIPIPCAVEERTERVVFHYTDDAFCNGGRGKSPVTPFALAVVAFNPTAMLNAEPRRISFLKVDTEGHDATVIRMLCGSGKIHPTAIRMEFYPYVNEAHKKDQYGLARSLGYQVFDWISGKPVSEQQALTRKEVWDALCV